MAGKRKAPSQKDLDFVRWYTSPASPTYDNAVQSAIRAGFSESYSKSRAYRRLVPLAKELVINKLAEKTEQAVDRGQFYNDLLRDAEQGIAERVRMQTGGDSKMKAIQQKDQHFVAERIGKERWASKQIVENSGLFTLTPDTLATLSNALSGATQQQQPAIKADYTVKLEDQDTKSDTKE